MVSDPSLLSSEIEHSLCIFRVGTRLTPLLGATASEEISMVLPTFLLVTFQLLIVIENKVLLAKTHCTP